MIAVFHEQGDEINDELQGAQEGQTYEKSVMVADNSHLQDGTMHVLVSRLAYDIEYERRKKGSLKKEWLTLIDSIKHYSKSNLNNKVKLDGLNFDPRAKIDFATASVHLDDVGLINYLLKLGVNFVYPLLKGGISALEKAQQLESEQQTSIRRKIVQAIQKMNR